MNRLRRGRRSPGQSWLSTTRWPWALALCAVVAVILFVLRPGVRVAW